MQLSLFQETFEPDSQALARCLKASLVAVDVETETRWPGRGPRIDYGLSYSADLTVIALAWDSSYVLYDGVLDDAEIARLAANVPLQEAGRFTARDLILSRANKSARLFSAVDQTLTTLMNMVGTT